MHQNQILPSLKLCILLAASFTLTGCLLDEDFESSSGSRGSLSGAMKASASGSTQPVHGSGYWESHRDTHVDTDVNVAVAAASSSSSSSSSSGNSSGTGKSLFDEGRIQMLLDVGYSVPFNGQFESITRYTFQGCFENDHFCGGVYASFDPVEMKSGTLAAEAVKNTIMLELGFSGRYYLTPAHAFISPYFSANLGAQYLFWDYRNPVYTSDGNKITSDSLPAVGGYAGFGIAFWRNSHVNLFAEAGFGGTAFLSQTKEGFENDVFDDFGYFSIRAGLGFKF